MIIDALGLAGVIIKTVIYHHGLLDSNNIDQGLVFPFKY